MAHANSSAAVELWAQLLEAFRSQIPEQSFVTWIQPLAPQKLEDNSLVLVAPSQFHREWIEAHYVRTLELVLRQLSGENLRLTLQVAVRKPRSEAAAEPVRVSLHSEPAERDGDYHLNSRYQFENFIEGPTNTFARAACLAVTDYTHRLLWNPLLIYGGTGLGKTHLLQAIGNRVAARYRSYRVIYVSAERFTQDFIQSVRTSRMADFSQRYRTVDLLLVDDIHFFAAKERTQIEFFHAFNALYQAGKRIVLTSDRPVSELAGFDQRLISRFDSGLVTNINPPDLETRLAILEHLAQRDGFPMTRDVGDFLATHVTSNVRELEGTYVTLAARCQLMRVPPTLDVVRDVLCCRRGQLAVARAPAERILDAVAEHFKFTREALCGKSRKKELVFARMIGMTLMTEMTPLSLKAIGTLFGGRDHTTVIHARDTIRERRDHGDSEIIQACEVLQKCLSLSTPMSG